MACGTARHRIGCNRKSAAFKPELFRRSDPKRWVHAWTADFDPAVEHFLRCVRLNPVDPLLGHAYCGLAFVHNLKGEYEEGTEYAKLTAHNMPGWIFGWVHLA